MFAAAPAPALSSDMFAAAPAPMCTSAPQDFGEADGFGGGVATAIPSDTMFAASQPPPGRLDGTDGFDGGAFTASSGGFGDDAFTSNVDAPSVPTSFGSGFDAAGPVSFDAPAAPFDAAGPASFDAPAAPFDAAGPASFDAPAAPFDAAGPATFDAPAPPSGIFEAAAPVTFEPVPASTPADFGASFDQGFGTGGFGTGGFNSRGSDFSSFGSGFEAGAAFSATQQQACADDGATATSAFPSAGAGFDDAFAPAPLASKPGVQMDAPGWHDV